MNPVTGASTVVRFGPFEVNLETGELRKHGVHIKLQDQPFRVLAMLLERPGELVTREEIKQRLWPAHTFVDFDHGVNTAMRRLREALSDSADLPRLIETIPRRGYRFIGAVNGVLPRGQMELDLDGTAVAPPVEVPAKREISRNTILACAVALVLALAAASAWELIQRNRVIRSIAVLPLVNESKDANLDYLCRGLPGRLIERLSGIEGLRVVSQNSSSKYSADSAKTNEIAQALGVRALVLGSVRQRGDKLEVSVELLDTKDDRHLWGREYAVPAAEASSLEGSMARDLAGALRPRISPALGEDAKKGVTNPTSYEAYLRGDAMMEVRRNSSFQMALTYFQKAVDADPNFALGYVGMAKAYGLLSGYGGMPSAVAQPLSEAAVNRALELDPNLGIAHSVKGVSLLVLHRDMARSEQEFKRGLALNPNLAEGHYGLAELYQLQRRMDDAIAEITRAEELDPLWPGYATIRAHIYLNARRWDDAIKLRATRPNLKEDHVLYARIYSAAGRRKEALAEISQIGPEVAMDAMGLCSTALVQAMVGNSTEARRLLREGMKRQEAVGSNKVSRGCMPYNRAVVYAALGDKAEMLAELDRSEKSLEPNINHVLVDAVFDPYRSDAGFQNIVQRVTTPR